MINRRGFIATIPALLLVFGATSIASDRGLARFLTWRYNLEWKSLGKPPRYLYCSKKVYDEMLSTMSYAQQVISGPPRPPSRVLYKTTRLKWTKNLEGYNVKMSLDPIELYEKS